MQTLQGLRGELKQPLCPGVSPCMSQHVLAKWLCWHCSVLFPEVMLTLSPTCDSPAQHLPAGTLCITMKLQEKQPQHLRCLRVGEDFYPVS